MKTTIPLLVFLISLLISCSTNSNQHSMETIDNILNNLIEKEKTPAVSYLIFDSNSVIQSYHAGFSDISGRREADANTTFGGFSTTKTFTALAILQLAESERVNIDDRVKNYVQDFPYAPEITIRQLLAHSSGIPNPNPLSWVHLPEERSEFDRDAYFAGIISKNLKTKSSPNEKYGYSNLGYIYLGQIIEIVSGLSYEDYIRNNILLPAGIENTELDFVITEENLHAKGYQKRFSIMNLMIGIFMDKTKYMDSPEGKWKPFKTMYINGPSYGGLKGSPTGFMKYIQELLKPDCRILSDPYKEMLFQENILNSNKKSGMCLSWHTGQLNEHNYFTHAGGGGGYYCEIRIYPEAGLGSVIMFNRTGVRDERFLDELDKFYVSNPETGR